MPCTLGASLANRRMSRGRDIHPYGDQVIGHDTVSCPGQITFPSAARPDRQPLSATCIRMQRLRARLMAAIARLVLMVGVS